MKTIAQEDLEKIAAAVKSIGPLKEANKRLKKLIEVDTPRLLKLANVQDFVLQQIADEQLDPSRARAETVRLLGSEDFEVEKIAYERGFSTTSYNGFKEPVESGTLDHMEKSARGWAMYNGEEVDPVTEFLLEVREEVYGTPNPLSH